MAGAGDDDWDGRKMFDLYLHDYLKRKNLHRTAEIFKKEAKVSSKHVAITDSFDGLLHEWWTIFYDTFDSRQSSEQNQPNELENIPQFAPPPFPIPPQYPRSSEQPVPFIIPASSQQQQILSQAQPQVIWNQAQQQQILSQAQPQVIWNQAHQQQILSQAQPQVIWNQAQQQQLWHQAQQSWSQAQPQQNWSQNMMSNSTTGHISTGINPVGVQRGTFPLSRSSDAGPSGVNPFPHDVWILDAPGLEANRPQQYLRRIPPGNTPPTFSTGSANLILPKSNLSGKEAQNSTERRLVQSAAGESSTLGNIANAEAGNREDEVESIVLIDLDSEGNV